MANLKYLNIMDRAVIYNVLVKQKTPIHKAAKKLSVPYACLLNQAKKHLSESEMEVVHNNRERTRYTNKEKRKFVKMARLSSYDAVSAQYGIHVNLMRAWRRKFRILKLAKLAALAEQETAIISS